LVFTELQFFNQTQSSIRRLLKATEVSFSNINLKEVKKLEKSKTKVTVIALILLLTVATFIIYLPTVNAYAFNLKTFAFLTVSPNPIGVGQTALIVMWLDKLPPLGVQGSWDASWANFLVTVTKPNGDTQTLGPFNSDPVGSRFATYVPDQLGTFTFQMSFPGQEVAAYDAYYEASTSIKVELTVQQEPILEYPPAQLPTDYWQRPIEAENREWYEFSGNWLGTSKQTFGASAYNSSTNGDTSGTFNPYTKAPNTAHIVWTRPLIFGGLIGGEFGGTGTSSYYTGREYESKFTPPVIMQGRLYYNQLIGATAHSAVRYSAGVHCIDIRTGEELWFKNDMLITNGQIYNYKSPNQYGGIPYLWDMSGSTWHMYDAFTGDWILDIANATRGTIVMSPVGDMLVYILNGQNNWLTMWNSSAIPAMLGGPTGTEAWQWRPPVGKTLDWKDGIEWNVTVPDVPGSQRIALLGSDLILAIASSPETFARAASWQMEVTYDAKTGEQLWVENRTFPTATTTWGLNAYMAEGVIVEFIASEMEWYGIDAYTGEKLWGPTEPYTSSWGMYQSGACIAYGKLYSQVLPGVYAYDLNTGEQLWDFPAPSSGLETAYGIFPFQQGGFTIADGKLYTGDTHSHTEPLYRGAKLIAIDTETGNQVWNISFWRSGWNNPPVVADGYLLANNGYDNQIYCFGKGLTDTTVTASSKVIAKGDTVLIEGTVTDQSPGNTCLGIPAAGTPAIADEYMTEWMEYLYMQKPCPDLVEGVEVVLETLDPNNNFYEIGTVTSDASGMFKLMWEPPVPGEYTIIATFKGSESYWSSYTETAIGVTEAPSPAGPIEPEPTEPIEAPLISTEVAIILAAVIVAVAVITGFWIIKKRK
jgi:hypothetical protein